MTPRFVFRGGASAVGATFYRIDDSRDRQYDVPLQGASVLAPTGGISESRVRQFRLAIEHPRPLTLLSLDSCYTSSQASFAERERCTARVMANAEELLLVDQLRVGRIQARLEGERLGAAPMRFKLAECEIAEMRLGRQRVLIEFDLERPAEWTGEKRSQSPALDSFVKRIWLDKPSDEDIRIDGHTILWHGFGRIVLGERLVWDDFWQVTLLRVEMGSPVAGRAFACDLQCGGSVAPEPMGPGLAGGGGAGIPRKKAAPKKKASPKKARPPRLLVEVAPTTPRPIKIPPIMVMVPPPPVPTIRVAPELAPEVEVKPTPAPVPTAEPAQALDDAFAALADESTTPPAKRYPSMSFYEVRDGVETAVAKTTTLAAGPDAHYEFHFWIDTRLSGIDFVGERGEWTPPANVSYPIHLQVRVWSDAFGFAEKSRDLEVAAAGASAHARFPISQLPPYPGKAELFVFLEHEGRLVGAFRVEARVTASVQKMPGAQVVENAYLATDWFRIHGGATPSALTIFVTKKQGLLRMFTLQPEGDPWVTIGPSEAGLYNDNLEIYDEVQTLARRAESAGKEEFRIAKEGARLANLGWVLFGKLFLQAEEEGPRKLFEDYVAKLPEGSALHIAIGYEAQNLYLPWGLLYDEPAPQDYFDVARLRGFWGYRFNLSVRPPVAWAGAAATGAKPIRMGAAWLKHVETEELRKAYAVFEQAGSLAVEPVVAESNSLPALAQKPYGLIEFFCHGHTKLPSDFSQDQTRRFLQEFSQGDPANAAKQKLLMDIRNTSDSLLELDGGLVTLTNLAYVLKQAMPGSPIILLSMCESAQVSSSGTGFVPLFLKRGARAVIGTEGPTMWSLSRELDTGVVGRMLQAVPIGTAFYEIRKELAKTNLLALVYTLYGDADALLVSGPPSAVL